jgi:hypothetical protein
MAKNHQKTVTKDFFKMCITKASRAIKLALFSRISNPLYNPTQFIKRLRYRRTKLQKTTTLKEFFQEAKFKHSISTITRIIVSAITTITPLSCSSNPTVFLHKF